MSSDPKVVPERVPIRDRLAQLSGRLRSDNAERGRATETTGDRQHVSGLQRVAFDNRARLLRFLEARGAGHEAEDLFQELWQRVAATPSQPIAEPMSYLFRAAENLLRDLRRSRTSDERRQFDWQELTVTAQETPGGDRVLIARQRLAAVEAALDLLGPRVSAIFRRYRIEGINQGVIAREFGISLSLVEKDLQKAYRALAKLKAKFDAE